MKLSVASLTYNCDRAAMRHQFCSIKSSSALPVERHELMVCVCRTAMRSPPLCIFASECDYLLKCGSHITLYTCYSRVSVCVRCEHGRKVCARTTSRRPHIGGDWRAIVLFFLLFFTSISSFNVRMMCAISYVSTLCGHVNMRTNEETEKKVAEWPTTTASAFMCVCVPCG